MDGHVLYLRHFAVAVKYKAGLRFLQENPTATPLVDWLALEGSLYWQTPATATSPLIG